MYAYARDVAECTWVEKVVSYIDALPVFLKIVVVFREKVGGFRTFDGGNSNIQFVQCFSSF